MALDQQTLNDWVETYSGLEDLYPATGMQLGLVFHSLLDGRQEAYATQLQTDFEGGLDAAVFRRAWDEMLLRHAIFRTAFVGLDLDEPLQVVVKEARLDWREEDWRTLDCEAQERAFARYRKHDKGLGFDFSRAPLMRMSLLRLSERRYRWLWTHHHSLLDGWSVAIVMEELFELYAELLGRREAALPRSPAYRDYIAWLCAQDRSAAKAYWRGALSGVTPTQLGLPEWPSVEEREGQEAQELVISEPRTAGLRELAQRHGVTLNTVILGAWAYLLHRYSGQREVVFGQTVSGRSADVAGIGEMVGLFINTLPVRVEITRGEVIGEWLRGLHREQAQRESHGYLPLVEIQRLAGLAAGEALFDTLLVFENYPVGESLREAGRGGSRLGFEVRGMEVHEGTGYGLTLMVQPGQKLFLKLLYQRTRYDRETIAALLGHVGVILDGLVDSGIEHVQDLPYLRKADYEDLVERRNATARAHPHDKCIHELFEEQTRQRLDAVALVHEGGELTYGELNRRANGLAHRLIERGVGPEVSVGLCLERSAEMVVGILGILKAGGCYVPLNSGWPALRLDCVIDDSGVELIVCDRAAEESLDSKSLAGGEGRIRFLRLEGDGTNGGTTTNPVTRVEPRNLAYAIYPADGSGELRGVLGTHRSLSNLAKCQSRKYGVGAHSLVLHVSSGVGPAPWDWSMALLSGGALHVVPQEIAGSADRFGSFVKARRIDYSYVSAASLNGLRRSDFDSVDVMTVDGPSASLDTLREWSAGRRLYKTYGVAESAGISTIGECEATAAFVGIGKPIENVSAYVLGPDGDLLPRGVVGELHLGGVGLSRGYLNRPGLTAQKFMPHRFSRTPGERLYRTGDLVRWLPDGSLEYLSRVDDQVRDFRIELGEIAAALLVHHEVGEAEVVALEAQGARPRLAAYVVERAPGSIAAERFIAQLKAHLRTQPRFGRLPDEWIVLESLPRTAAGAVDRSALPQPEGRDAGLEYVAPRTELERTLAEVWQQRLGIERVGIEDNYFALGGDSIRSISLVAEARKRGVQFSVQDLFAYPTVSGLALAVERGEVRSVADAEEEIGPFELLTDREREQLSRRHDMDEVEDAYPLSLIQQGMVLESLRHAHLNVYLNFQIYEFKDQWDPRSFEQALRYLVARHPVLRSIHDFSGERPLQLVLKEKAPELKVVDVQDLDRAAVQAALGQWTQSEQSLGLDTSVSLWRANVHVLPGEQFLFGMHLHHALWDGWSLESFATELYASYGLLKREGRVAEHRPLPSYNRFIALEQSAVSSEAHREYWTQKLEGATVPWWTGREKSASAFILCELSEQTNHRLTELARSLGVQEKSVWCSVYLALLSLLSGTDEAVGTVLTQGRPEIPDGDKIIGVFLNVLPVRMRMSGRRWADLITETDRELREQHAFRHYPLAEIQRLTGLDFSAAMFNYSNWHVYYEGVDREGTREEWIPQRVGVWQDTNYLLSFLVNKDDKSQRYNLSIGVDTKVFDAAFRERIRGYAAKIVEAIAGDATAVIEKTGLLSDAERQQQLLEWNATARAYPHDKCIHELFEERARQRPEAVALVHEGRELTYGELNRCANRLARRLIERGVGPEVRVGLCMERSAEMVIGILGILKAGGCYVPLDPSYPRKRLEYLLEDAEIGILVTEASVAMRVAGPGRDLLLVNEASPPMPSGMLEDVDRKGLGLCPEHPAYLIYTSASTGAPKGVLGLHRSIVNRVSWLAGSLGADEVLCQKTSVGFVDHVAEIFQALSAGVPLLIVSPSELQAPRKLLRTLDARRVTRMTLVPSLLKTVLEAAEGEAARWLKSIHSSGEALHLSGLERFEGCFPQARLFNIYGSTEMGADVTCQEVEVEDLQAESARLWAPIGKGIDNAQAYVLDADGQMTVSGAVGELHVGGVCLSRGYFKRAGLTAQRFVPHPFSREPGERVYRTGDLARWLPDGNLEFLGRADHQVKVRGFRIELGEIESVLLAQDGVRDAAVVAREESSGDKRLVGYVVAEAGAQADQAALVTALRGRLQEQLPGYMVPSALMVLPSLPLTANGKLDRKALPAPEESTAEAEHTPPEGVTEEVLAELWCALLKRERVGRHDNFFALGGHSLLAMQLASRIRETFSTELPVRELFEHSTLSSQAGAIERARGAGAPAGIALEAVSREQPLPLSYAQERLWFLHQYMGPNAVYNMPLGLRLRGELDEAALVRSLEELHRRHEALRTRFENRDGSAVQVIDPPGLELEVEAVSAAEAKVIGRAERHYYFDLSSERLCRIRLLRETASERGDAGDYVLLVTMHHSISDGWSLGIFFRELVSVYRAYTNGESSPLAPLPIQYADYAQWQRRWLQGAVLERQLSYWREQLEGLPPLLTLPTDRPRPAEQTFRGSTERLALPAGLTQRLQAVSREQGVTLYMTLLSAFAVLLGRYSGQQDVAVGTPIANRTRRETEGLIGFFVNTLVMRHDLSGDPRFVDLLEHTREVALQAYAHQDIPFEQLVEELNPQRSLSHSPLFQVAFALQNVPFEALELSGLTVRPFDGEQAEEEREGAPGGTARFDLTLSVQESAAGLVGGVEYNTDLFERGTIRRLLGHYELLLEAVVAAPQARLSRLEMLGEEEQRRLLLEWNATARAYPHDECIHELFEEQARLRPDAVAVVHEGSELTYAELNRHANQFAHYLRERGVGPNKRVAICVRRRLPMVEALLGILKAGGAYVPLDPSYPPQRLGYLLTDSEPVLLVVDGAGREALSGRALSMPVIDLEADAPTWAEHPVVNPSAGKVGLRSHDLAYVIYTSGSTGAPKGVMVEHRGLCNLARAQSAELDVGESSRVLQFASLSFDASAWEIVMALCSGAKLYLPAGVQVLAGESLLEVLRQSGITHATLPPAVLNGLAERERLEELRTLIVAGEACSQKVVESWAPGRQFVNAYGPTETTVCATMYRCDAQQRGVPAIGRPIANARTYVLDLHLRPVPIGVAGEIYIGGAGVARGYLNRARLTAERFVPDPFGRGLGARLYRTGDVGRWLPDGNLEFLGRADHQVKVRGFRIELGEIESVLLAQDGVRDAAVVAREESSGDKRLVGYVVAEAGVQADQAALVTALRGRLQEQLPGYMVPSALMVLPSLPLTANGKLDRKALPAPEESTAEAEHTPPEGVTEEVLAELWCALLKRERVGRHDGFFALGGHSLLVTQLASRIRETFSTELPLRELFEHSTLSSQAGAIERARGAGAPADVRVEAVSREQPLPLSYAQERLWFLQQYMGPNAVYNMPLGLRLRGELDEAALVRSLEELHRRHEALRTRFENRDGSAVQVIDPPGLELEVEAVSAAEAKVIGRAERHYYFDLSSERLCRIRLLRETASERGDAGDYVLLVTMHHSISDGWSLGIFFRELVSVYRAYTNGESSPLAPLPIQYADYAQWQRCWLQGAVLERQLSYWREQLEGLPPLLTLPTDRPRPAEQTFRGSTERLALPAGLTQRLQAVSREQGVTLYMTLLSAFAVLLGRYSGQQDVAVGTPIANRTRRETEGLIGFFVNTLVMRHDLSGDPRFVDLLEHTREVALQAYAHQDIPFEQLVEELNPQRSLSHSPLFQVAFALQNVPFEALELSGLTVRPFDGEQAEEEREGAPGGTARFDLTLNVQESAAGLVGGVEYNTDLFERGTIRRLLGHYERLLEAVVAAPQARLSRLEMLGEEERHRQLVEWNARSLDYPRDKSVHELFEEEANRSPEAIAVVDEDRRLTYRELNERANRLAHCLIEQGVAPGDPVGLCVDRDAERAVGVLGILKAGGAYVALDPDYPAERVEYLLEDSGVELIVTQSSVQSRLELQGGVESCGRRWVELEAEGALQGYRSTNPGVAVSAAALACLRYEADHAGVPVGRMGSHVGVLEGSMSGGRASAGEWMASLWAWPTRGASRYVLDRDGEVLPVGAVGELYIGGEGVGWGYRQRAGLTAERFVPNAFSAVAGERWYRTGERARWRVEGTLELVGRAQEAWRSRGTREERIQIERALSSHEGVREAVVVAFDAVQGQPRLAAYVVERAPGSIAAERFIAQLKAHLRTQPMFCPLPDEWRVLESLPRTAAGAVDRSALPQPEGRDAGLEYVAPRTELEKTLVEVWQERLGIERVGIEDNYFALGGDSIRSISLVAEARKRGVRFSVKDLFAYPTVSGLASAVERGEVRSDVDVEEEIEPFALLTERERERLGQRHDREAVEDAYPLSLMQQGMVLESLRYAHLNVYLNFQIYEFKDQWDPPLFERALRHLIARHPLLRSIHASSGERPLQLVLKEHAPELKVVDVRDLDKAAVQAALGEWAQSELALGLDTSVSLWRATVHVLPGEQFLFGMCLHHALWDGWSLESFATELYASYGLLKREGRVAEHRPLPSYNRFIALEQSAIASKAHREYWTQKLEEATVPWWTGREKSASALIECEISAQTSHKLSELARSLGVQEKSVWCSVYLALLSLLSGTDEAVGTVMTQGRPEIPDGDKIIGVFLNALPIRVRTSGRRWADLITATDRELREQHAFRHYPLAEIQRLTGLDFAAATFNYSNWHVYYEGVDREGTREEWIPRKVGGWQETNYLLSVLAHKDDKTQRCELTICADAQVFDAAFRERIRGYVANIVDAIAGDATGIIEKTALLSDAERQQQLLEWNATARAHPDDQCIHELFEERARACSREVAVTDGDRCLTYEDLDRRANQLSRYLVEQGVGPEVAVGVCIARSVEMVVGLLGILKAGGCYVPLDPEYPAERLAYILSTSDCRLVLSELQLLEKLPALSAVKTFPLNGDLHDERLGKYSTEKTPAHTRSSPCNSAYVIFTSGSTGKPKGVRISHESLSNYLFYAGESYFSRRAGAVVSTSLCFDATVTSLLVPLIAGKFTYLVKQDGDEFERLKQMMSKPGEDLVFKLTPAHMEVLEPLIGAAVTNAHLLVIGGEQLTKRRISKWQRSLLPRSVFVNEYGPTETVVGCSTYWVAEPLWPVDESGAVPIGRPIRHTSLYAVDEGLELVPMGVPGELLIGGAGVAQAYANQPAQTAERFIPNPFGGAPGERLYRTGDIVRWLDSGDLEYVGRADTQVKIRGFRIELGEIEAVMLRHARVKDTVAVGRKDDSGHDRVVVYVVEDVKSCDEAVSSEVDQGAKFAATNNLVNELRLHAQAFLPAYMLPSVIVVMNELPMTSNGKRNLEALPKPDFASFQAEFVAPRNDTERSLCSYWQDLLKVEQIGIHDNFWALGGQSLLALRVCNFVRQEFGVELKLSEIFAHPSIVELAEQISFKIDAINLNGSKRLICDVTEEVEDGIL